MLGCFCPLPAAAVDVCDGEVGSLFGISNVFGLIERVFGAFVTGGVA